MYFNKQLCNSILTMDFDIDDQKYNGKLLSRLKWIFSTSSYYIIRERNIQPVKGIFIA